MTFVDANLRTVNNTVKHNVEDTVTRVLTNRKPGPSFIIHSFLCCIVIHFSEHSSYSDLNQNVNSCYPALHDIWNGMIGIFIVVYV